MTFVLSLLFQLLWTFGTQEFASANSGATSPAVHSRSNFLPKKGGDFTFQRPNEPYSLNPIISDGHEAVDIQFHIIEPLLTNNPDTYEWIPCLAEAWIVHPDGKTYDFVLRANARWSDGRPVTAADVKFSFDVIFDPNFPTAHMRPYYEGLESVEILGPRKVRFHAKNSYFGNFISSAGLPIVLKHIYSNKAVGPTLHHDLIGSGPYRLERWQKGIRIVLKKNKLWWGEQDPFHKKTYNPNRIIFRFLANEMMALEMLKKGELDFMPISADAYAKRTNGTGWGTKAFKVKARNLYPKSTQFIAWNLDRPLFQDRRVRVALAHLMDRKKMIDLFNFGLSLPATGPWYQQSPYADPSVAPLGFDPERASELLRQAGWSDSNEDGVLDREFEGRRQDFSFTIITGSRGSERFLTMFQEDAKQAGVDIRIKVLDWTIIGSVLDRRDFDAFQTEANGGLVDFDPKPTWHSSSIGPGLNNLTGYNNKEVDELIDEARLTPEREKRIPLLQRVYRIVANDSPALFLFDDAYAFYAHSSRVRRPRDTFRYDVGTKFWWVEP